MGATEILKVMKIGEELTTNEIAERVEVSVCAVKQSMKRLLKDVSTDLNFRLMTPDEKNQKYGRNFGCKIRIYWLNKNE